MELINMKILLQFAQKNRIAVGAFTIWSLDSAQAVIDAANELDMPVIMQAGDLECNYAGMENIAEIARMAVRKSKVPAALNLDHGASPEWAENAIKAGFTSVMIDASKYGFEENIRITKEVVAMAKSAGVSVEAELGRIGGAEGKIGVAGEDAAQTDPQQARKFAERTGIDALAVAIGTAHGFYTESPVLNIERLKKIAAATEVPLVLHGGSGTPDDQVAEAIQNGITKINICTEFVAAMGKGYISAQNAEGFRYNVPNLFNPAKEAGRKLVYDKIKFFANGYRGVKGTAIC